MPAGPVVFYSPNLNTCVHIGANLFTGKTVTQPPRSYMKEYVSVEDLLSGQSLLEDREFDLNDPAEAKAARDYQAGVIKRFGGEVPLTGLPPGREEAPKSQK